MRKASKQEMLIICDSMLQDIKSLKRALKMNLPTSATQEITEHIEQLLDDLQENLQESHNSGNLKKAV